MNSTAHLDITNLGPAQTRHASGRSVLVPGLHGELSWRRPAIGPMVTVALLAVTFVGIYFAFGPVRNGWNQQQPASLAAISATPATPDAPAGETRVVEQISFGGVDFLPPAATAVEFRRTEVAPGAKVSVLADAEGHALYVIESGSLDALFAGDVQMTEDGTLHGVLFGGEERHMEAGEGFVMESNFGGELHNTGKEPLKLAVIRIVHSAASQVTGSETIPLP